MEALIFWALIGLIWGAWIAIGNMCRFIFILKNGKCMPKIEFELKQDHDVLKKENNFISLEINRAKGIASGEVVYLRKKTYV